MQKGLAKKQHRDYDDYEEVLGTNNARANTHEDG